jgi:hypothetical protein
MLIALPPPERFAAKLLSLARHHWPGFIQHERAICRAMLANPELSLSQAYQQCVALSDTDLRPTSPSTPHAHSD